MFFSKEECQGSESESDYQGESGRGTKHKFNDTVGRETSVVT